MKYSIKYFLLLLFASCFFYQCADNHDCDDDMVDVDPDPDPDPEIEDTIVFAAIGDYGKAGDTELAVSQLVKSWSPDFIITLGDNNYSDGELETIEENISQYYCDFIYNPDAPSDLRCEGAAYEAQDNRFFPSIGNHDENDGNADPYFSYFTLPGNEYYYDFVKGSVHFFCLDTSTDDDIECCAHEQAVWLKEKLAASTAPFKIVYFHHSPYSTSKHGNEEEMQWPFEEWGATAILTGHDHVYQRIHKKENPAFPYFVCGVSGKSSFYDCGDEPLDEDDFDVLCIDDEHGAMKMIATKDQLTFQFFSTDSPGTPSDEFIVVGD